METVCPQIKGTLPMRQDLERNRESAIDFYTVAYHGNPSQAVRRYVGENYIQHNPLVKDGKERFIEYFEGIA
ncbi:MAG: hypothetical protein PQJ47_07240 [Sphaerochaetaceae bacterium]|nr:hypothetical protein [Sphaerochaetaceae bacterium]